jgi:hypothetical protein
VILTLDNFKEEVLADYQNGMTLTSMQDKYRAKGVTSKHGSTLETTLISNFCHENGCDKRVERKVKRKYNKKAKRPVGRPKKVVEVIAVEAAAPAAVSYPEGTLSFAEWVTLQEAYKAYLNEIKTTSSKKSNNMN